MFSDKTYPTCHGCILKSIPHLLFGGGWPLDYIKFLGAAEEEWLPLVTRRLTNSGGRLLQQPVGLALAILQQQPVAILILSKTSPMTTKSVCSVEERLLMILCDVCYWMVVLAANDAKGCGVLYLCYLFLYSLALCWSGRREEGRGVFEDVAMMMLMFFRGLHRASARTTMSSHTGDGADIHQRRALVGDGGGEAVVAAEVWTLSCFFWRLLRWWYHTTLWTKNW